MNCKKCQERVGNYGDAKNIREASWLLHAPDGKPNPGGFYCNACVDAIIAEFDKKLGEAWYALRVDEFGHLTHLRITRSKT